jgi:hypothetical protein
MHLRTNGVNALAATLITLSAVPVAAQSAGGPHLIIGIGAGWVGGTSLWDVPAQPILSTDNGPDLFHLHRDIGAGVTFTGYGSYFPGAHVGITGDLTFLGLDGSDRCEVVQDGGDGGLLDACRAIPGSPSSITAAIVQAGIILRPLANGPIRPYIKGMGGIAFTPGSTTAMRSFYDGSNILTVYDEDASRSARFTWSASAGVTVAPSPGYQFFVEVRTTALAEDRVTGATLAQGSVPPSQSVVKHFPSVLAGFEIALERGRGRTP